MPATRLAQGVPQGPRESEPRPDLLYRIVVVLWFLVLFDPQWLLATNYGLTPLLRLPAALMVVAFITVLVNQKKGDWFPGVAAWVALTAMTLPLAYNPVEGMKSFRQLIFYWVVCVALVRAVRTPRAAAPLIFMLCVGQYLWWSFWGLRDGLVYWHHFNANYDAFGPLMAMGVGPAYFYASAVRSPWKRRLAYLVAAICVVGVISAFARGAVLSLVATAAYIWLRSPHKVRALGVAAVAVAVFTIAGSMIDGTKRGTDTAGSFWTELLSSFDEGDNTATDRKVLWGLANKVFLHHPVLGAGAQSFGAAAVSMFHQGALREVQGQYAANPNTLYGRALHNIFYQILAEFGIAGVAIFLYLLAVFWRNSQAVQRPAARAAWREAGGVEDVGRIALGIEASMVAFLATGYFYNQLFNPWFFTLIAANALLYSIVKRISMRSARPTPGRGGFVGPTSLPALPRSGGAFVPVR